MFTQIKLHSFKYDLLHKKPYQSRDFNYLAW